MRPSSRAFIAFSLAASAPACIVADAMNPFVDAEEGCLEAGEQVVVDLSEAKAGPRLDATTVPAWTRAPDSTGDHVHVRVLGCEEGWASWSAVMIVGDVPAPEALVVRTRTLADGTWIDASLSAQDGANAEFSAYSEGGDLEVAIDLAGAPGARIDQLVLVRTCSTHDWDASEDPADDVDYDYDDDGC